MRFILWLTVAFSSRLYQSEKNVDDNVFRLILSDSISDQFIKQYKIGVAISSKEIKSNYENIKIKPIIYKDFDCGKEILINNQLKIIYSHFSSPKESIQRSQALGIYQYCTTDPKIPYILALSFADYKSVFVKMLFENFEDLLNPFKESTKNTIFISKGIKLLQNYFVDSEKLVVDIIANDLKRINDSKNSRNNKVILMWILIGSSVIFVIITLILCVIQKFKSSNKL